MAKLVIRKYIGNFKNSFCLNTGPISTTIYKSIHVWWRLKVSFNEGPNNFQRVDTNDVVE